MNLPTEDNNLPLFKYAPEITSQLLIQTNEAQEYIQIPNIGDDLLLTGLEDGTYAWTLNSLPVLLNNQNDSQSLLVNQEESLQELNSQKEILSDFLGTETVDNQYDTQTNETEIIFPLELPEKKFLTDNGLYITNNHEDISSNLVNNVALNSENIQSEESSNDNIKNEIQSSDVSSQEAFVDINGLLISQESILNLNTPDFPFNIQESNDINVTLSNNKLKNKKQKTTAKRSLKINSLNNNNSQRLNGEDVETVQNQIESDNNENLFNIDDFKIINLGGTSTFLNINASTDQINSNIDIENNRKIDDLSEIGLQIDNEPDSTTILNDFDETLNINELATIVQTFQCKKCDFSCNDREEFLTHFKEVHYVLTKKKPQVFPLKKVNDTLPKNLKIKKVSLIKDHKVKRLKKSDDTNFQLIINERGNLISEIPEPVFENPEIPVLNDNENTSVLKEESVEIINDSHLNDQENNSLINFTESVSTTDSSQLSVENNINVESSVDSYQPIKIIYDDKEYTSFAVLIQHEEVEKKIMRVKRKKKQSKKKTLIELTQDFDKNTSGVTYSFTDVKKLHINKNSNISPSAVTVATDVSNIKELIQNQPIIQENIDESNLSPIFLCASDISSTVISSDVPAVEPEDELQLQTVDEQQNLSPIYVCATCNEQFATVEECKLHYIEVHKCEDKSNEFNSGDDNTKTIESDLKLIADSELPNHKQILEKFFNQDLKKRKHKCSVKGCPYRFAKIDLLKRHEACHVNGTRSPFCCPECKEQFNSWRMCSIHLWKCHKVDIDFYTCPLCDYKGSTCDKLKHHIKIHSEDREYICPDCGRDFKQPSQLRNHRVIHLDKNDLKSVPRWFIQKHCEMCGKLFADTKCLKKHIQAVHSKLKPFICNVCGHSCARKAMLQLHLRQHTGDKPYSCSICKYKTGDHNSLRRHIMRHTGDRPYKCPYCDYAAIQSNSYKNHLSTKHPGKNGFFKCNECSFKTVNEEIFHSHKNDHNLGLIQSDKSKTTDISTIINIHNDNTSSSEILNNNLSTNNGRIVEQLTDCNKKNFDIEDDETQNCLFSSLSDLTDEQTVDTGGITIPADPDPSVVSDASIEIWDLNNIPYIERTIPNKSNSSVEALCWYNKRLFSTGLSGELIEYDLTTLSQKNVIPITGGVGWCMDIHKKSGKLIIGTEQGYLNLYSLLNDGIEYLKVLDKQEGRILCLKFNSNGEYIASGSVDTIRIWNVKSGHAIHKMNLSRLTNNTETVVWCLLITDNFTVVSGDSRGYITFWDGETGSQIESYKSHCAAVLSICLSDDMKTIYCAGVDPVIMSYDRILIKEKTYKWVKSIQRKIHDHDVRSLIYADKKLYSAGIDGYLACSSYPPKFLVKYPPLLQNPSVSLAHNEKLILLRYQKYIEIWSLGQADGDGNIGILKLKNEPKKLLQLQTKGDEGTLCAAISSNGKIIIYSTVSRLRIFHFNNVSEGTPELTAIDSLPDEITSCVRAEFTPNNKQLILAPKSGGLHILNIFYNQALLYQTLDTSNYLKDTISFLKISSDGKYIVAADPDSNVVVFNFQHENWKYYISLPRYECPPTAIAIHPISNELVIVYSDHKIVEYNLKQKKFTDFSRSLNEKQPRPWLNRSFPIINVSFDPMSENILMLHDDANICVIDKNKKLSTLDKKIRKLDSSSIDKSRTSQSFHIVKRSKHLVYFGWLSEGEMVSVEISPLSLLDKLPPGLKKEKFGKK